MELDISVIIILILVYILTGCMDGIAGGGGLIAVPALLLAGIPPEFALGTNKLAVVFGLGASLGVFIRKGLVFWPLARVGAPISLIMALIGAKAILLFDSDGIGRIIVFLLPLAAGVTLLPKKDRSIQALPALPLGLAPLVACALIGFYDGFFGPASGSLYVLAFHFFANMGLLHASAISKLFTFVTLGAGAIVFAWHGKVLYLLAAPLILASIAGNLLGARIAIHIGPAVVRKVLVFSITLLFISLVWKFYLS